MCKGSWTLCNVCSMGCFLYDCPYFYIHTRQWSSNYCYFFPKYLAHELGGWILPRKRAERHKYVFIICWLMSIASEKVHWKASLNKTLMEYVTFSCASYNIILMQNVSRDSPKRYYILPFWLLKIKLMKDTHICTYRHKQLA